MIPFVFPPAIRAAETAAAPARVFHLDIPAGTLDETLTRLADQTGISVGMRGNLPHVATQAVAGEYTVPAALATLLNGTGFEALQVSRNSFRLQRVAAASATAAADSQEELAEVVVTGSKREQDWRTIPISMSVIGADRIATHALPGGSRAALLQDAALSSTNLGPGRNRQFIRGVADSPFLGPSQATVSVQFDESRATYDGPDPDLRLLDVEQVEILKGPQGPLYGTGALGGVYHIVPRRPDLTQWQFQDMLHVAGVSDGGRGVGADAVLNAPLVPDRLGLRAVGYAATEPGWIDNIGGRANANDTQVRGGRLALRGVLPAGWMLDFEGAAQLMHTADSQYLPGATHPPQRSGVLPEPLDNDFHLGAITLRGKWGGHNVLATFSHVWQEADAILDASDSATAWNAAAPLRYLDRRRYRLWNQEVRMWSDEGARVGWLVGGSYLSSSSDISGTLVSTDAALRQVLEMLAHVGEAALFGEASVPLHASLRATAGLRLFRSDIENKSRSESGQVEREPYVDAATPSFALDWRSPDQRRFYYLRFARAIRPGGLNPADPTAQYTSFRADQLSNLDLGMRLLGAEDAPSLQAAVFATRWQHIQSDYLLANGLIGTRNVGDGRNLGVEGTLTWAPTDSWSFETSATFQRPRLYHAEVAVGDDPRLPVVPDVRLHGAIARSFALGGWQGRLRTDVDYAGASRLSFEQSLDRKMGEVITVDGSLELRRDRLALALRLANLLDSHADTFAFGNPFSVRVQPQFTTQQPRTVTLSAGWNW